MLGVQGDLAAMPARTLTQAPRARPFAMPRQPAHVRRKPLRRGGAGAGPRALSVPHGRQLAGPPGAPGLQLLRLLLGVRLPHPGARGCRRLLPARRAAPRRAVAHPLLRAPRRGHEKRAAGARGRLRRFTGTATAAARRCRRARPLGDRDRPAAAALAQRGPSPRAGQRVREGGAQPDVPLLHGGRRGLRRARPRLARPLHHVHPRRLRGAGHGRRRAPVRPALSEGRDLRGGRRSPALAEARMYAGAGFRGSQLTGLLRDLAVRDHLAAIQLIGEDLPQAHNRVDLDPRVRDLHGFPVARITHTPTRSSARPPRTSGPRSRRSAGAPLPPASPSS